MGTQTALQLVNNALQELGLPQAQTITQSLDDQTGFQCLGLLNSLGTQLFRAHDWHFLEQTASILGNGVDDSYPLPSDFGRIVNQTQWSSANKRPMSGPTSSQAWSWVQYGIVSVGIYYRYRIIGDRLHIHPKLANGETVNFFYLTDKWAINGADNTPKKLIEGDSDKTIYDDYMLIAGLKYKLWTAKGMDSGGLYAEFEYMLANLKSQGTGAPLISLNRAADTMLLSGRNIPDGDWGV